MVITIQESKRFWRKVVIADDGGCWLWTASKDTAGYGLFRPTGSHLVKAHRYSWELSHNQKVPIGMQVCHSCDTPSCVNPSHLFVGTAQDNMDDRARKGRTVYGSKHSRTILTEQDVREIRKSTLSQRKIASQYGVSRGAIKEILNGNNWKWLV